MAENRDEVLNHTNAVKHLGRIKDQIMQTWETRVRNSVPSAATKSRPVLRNMLPEIIDNLVSNLSSDKDFLDFERSGTIGKEHGSQRASLDGYTLEEMLFEYRILRQVIFETLEQEKLHPPGVRNLILNVIDEGIQKATQQFAATRSRELEKSNMALEHFALVAAHDLKSPLATISGYMELLEDLLKGKIDPDALRYIKVIKRSAAEMTLLIDRLLEYSSISRRVEPFVPVSTNAIVKEVVSSLQSIIEMSGTQVVFDNLPQVSGDQSLLSQLFQNLISNAIKFRDQQRSPEIHIDAKEEQNHWLFSVTDNGIGFETKSSEELFVLFKKAHTQPAHKGYGIGLATCRKVVELHGGRIWAQSKPASGATFFFTLQK